jgi:hypothetical protein
VLLSLSIMLLAFIEVVAGKMFQKKKKKSLVTTLNCDKRECLLCLIDV